MLPERFSSKFEIRAGSDCWWWLAYRQPRGYGTFQVARNKSVLAHRYAFETLIGPIPEGLVLDHLCRNTSCVNPAHLEAVTQRENVLRGEAPAALAARRTHCVAGHSLADAYIYPNGRKRACRECTTAHHRKARANAKGD